MIDAVEFEDEAFSDFECFEEYELGADPLDVAMESALLEDEPEEESDEDPDLGDQSFEDFMDAWDFETPADDNDEEREGVDND